MPSTHVSLHYHLVFATKNRELWLPPTLRHRVHEYLGGVVRHLGGVPHAVGGTGDHVHVAVGLKATHCLADVMREVKSESSRWIHQELRLAGFAWQEGYGAFTFAAGDMEAVRGYVLNQEEHHRVKTFQEEYVEMLKRGMVEYDEKYLWCDNAPRGVGMAWQGVREACDASDASRAPASALGLLACGIRWLRSLPRPPPTGYLPTTLRVGATMR